jgi:hypothetical protein
MRVTNVLLLLLVGLLLQTLFCRIGPKRAMVTFVTKC